MSAPGIHRPLLLAVLCGAALACTEAWRPVTWVEGLRVLAIRAEPPDLPPGGSTKVSALVVAPGAPSPATLIWFACDPDPELLDQPECARFATLDDPAELGSSGELPEGVRPLGMTCEGTGCPAGYPAGEVTFQAPADVFAKAAPEDLRRRRGVIAMVMLLAIGDAPPDGYPPTEEQLKALMLKVQTRQVPSVLAVKRLRIAEDPALNRNPEVLGVRFGEEVWTAEQRFKLRPGESYPVSGVAREGDAERYQQVGPDGEIAEKDERLVYSWFGTAGEFSAPRSEDGSKDQRYVVPTPFDELPADRRATMYVVLRDGRGGVSWLLRRLYVCDPFREAATLSSMTPALGPAGTQIELRGENLEDALDVMVGDRFLGGGRWDPGRGAWVGSVPEGLAPGKARVVVRGRSCKEDPSAEFEITP